jgi:hypothetical protein
MNTKNTLNILQTVSKIAGIVCKVISVLCIVGFCLCVVGIVSLAVGAPAMQLGGVTFESMMQHNTEMTTGSLYAAMASGAFVCAGEAVLAKFALHYFKREQTDGTPFTFDGAKELLRLGILSLCIPVGTQILAQIAQTICTKIMTDVEPLELDMGGSVIVGALLIVMALLCKYGAELNAEKVLPTPATDAESAQTDSPDTDLQG